MKLFLTHVKLKVDVSLTCQRNMKKLFTPIVLLAASHFLTCDAFTPSTPKIDFMTKNVRTLSPKFVLPNSLGLNVRPKSTMPRRESPVDISLHAEIGGNDEPKSDGMEESGDTEEDGKKLPFKQRLRKMGTQVVLSYGFVSNMSYAISVSLAWYIHSVRTGISPFAPGQKKGFLAVYSGFYLFNNVIRPARFTLSLLVSKYFDRAVVKIQEKLNTSKSKATFILVLIANLFGTCAAMALGIAIASAASGVPVWRTN